MCSENSHGLGNDVVLMGPVYSSLRTGGQIGNNDSADDVRNVDLTKVHYLTGPFEIEGAEPGDLLLVEIMDVQVRSPMRNRSDLVGKKTSQGEKAKRRSTASREYDQDQD